MAAITTRHGSGLPPKAKPFTWSYSRLKNFEACPKRHYEIDIAKAFKDEDGTALVWGNEVHNALAARVSKGVPLPKGMEHFEHWAEKVLMGGGETYTEQNMGLAKDFSACGFFDGNVWFRAKVDFYKVVNKDIALVVDWKTGKILDDSVQLALSAACLFAKHPELRAVRAAFIWLKEDAETSEIFMRDDMPKLWRGLWPRIEALERAHNTMNYPPMPCRLCRSWCAVTACPNHGKSFQG